MQQMPRIAASTKTAPKQCVRALRTTHLLQGIYDMLKQSRTWIRSVTLITLLGMSMIASPAFAGPGGWSFDRSHTEINFSVKHFFTPVTGSFEDFEVDLDYNAEHPERSKVEVRIDVKSIDTGNEKRDGHLLTGDFFDVDNHPNITFKSKKVRQNGPQQLIATGDFTMRGTTREIELPITLLGTKEIPAGMQEMIGAKAVASFETEIVLNRNDYGVGAGNFAATVVVGGEVNVHILVEAHQS